MGEAQDAVAGSLEGCVASAVLLEGGAVAVVREAVQLDDEASVGPEGIDLGAEEGDVGRWGWEPVLAAEGDETILEWRAGGGCPLRGA